MGPESTETERLRVRRLKQNQKVWRQFQAFPVYYQRLKVFWIAETRGGGQKENDIARQVAEQRLDHLIKMTSQNKRYGSEPLADWE